MALGAWDKDAFPNVHRPPLIEYTLPISSADVERSFLLIKRIKTCTGSTVSEKRFSDLPVIAMHYPEIFEVNEICEAPILLFQAPLVEKLDKLQILYYAFTTLLKSPECCK